MARYWVVGGEYADAAFERIAGDKPEERIGPFESYEAAKAVWQARAWATVDNAQARYRIEEEGSDLRYWVVGCSYKVRASASRRMRKASAGTAPSTAMTRPRRSGCVWRGPRSTTHTPASASSIAPSAGITESS